MNNKKIIEKFKSSSVAKKALYILAFLLAYCFVLGLMAYCSGSLLKVFYPHESIFHVALKSKTGKPITYALWIGTTFLIVYILFIQNDETNSVKTKDARGVSYQKKSTFGSSEIIINEKEINGPFKVDNIENTTTTIYGQLLSSEKGEKVVGYQDELPPNVPEGSRNNLVIATMGSGKSFGFVRTEALQALQRNNSIILTDPSTELWADLSEIGRKKGADVRILNVRNPEYSDYWNCLEEIIDQKTERISGIKLGKFASTYMRNCAAVKKEDFWYKCAENLVATVIGFVAFERETFILNQYKQVFEEVKVQSEECEKFNARLDSDEIFISFVKVKNEIRKYAEIKGVNLVEIENTFDLIIEAANKIHPLTIAKVFEKIMDFDTTEGGFEQIPSCNPAYYYLQIYERESRNETIKSSAIHGTQQCFSVFADPLNRELLSREGIHLSDINKKQCMYFVSTSDTGNKAANVIASLFISFAFYDAQEAYDEMQDECRVSGKPNPCLPISAILDEFFSLGVLMGDENEFGTFMSDSRKRKIYVSIIIQYYPQLKINYGEEGRHQIQGGCETLLFMSGNDPETLRFIQDLIGESTVQVTSHKKVKSLFSTVDSNEFTVTDAKRYTLSQGEARQWQKGEILVIKQGTNPIKIKSFPWIYHPLYKDRKVVSIKAFKPLSQTLDDEFDKYSGINEDELKDKIEKQISDKVCSLNKYIINNETGEVLSVKSDENDNVKLFPNSQLDEIDDENGETQDIMEIDEDETVASLDNMFFSNMNIEEVEEPDITDSFFSIVNDEDENINFDSLNKEGKNES